MFLHDLLSPIVGKEFKKEVGKEIKARERRYEPITEYTITNEENFIQQLYSSWADDMKKQGASFPIEISNILFDEQSTLLNALLYEDYVILPKRKELFTITPQSYGAYISTSVGPVHIDFLKAVAYHLNFFTLFFSLNYPKSNLLSIIYERGMAKYFGAVKIGQHGEVANIQFAYPFRAITQDILDAQKVVASAVKKNLPVEKLYSLLTKYYRMHDIDYRYELFILSKLSSIVMLKQKKLEENIDEETISELSLNIAIALTSYYSLLDEYTQAEARQKSDFYHIIAKEKDFIKEIEKRYMSYFFENIVREEEGRKDNEFFLYGFMYGENEKEIEDLKTQLAAEILNLEDKQVSNVPSSDDLMAILIEKAMLNS